MYPSTNKEEILPKFKLKSEVKKLGIVFKGQQLSIAPALVITTLKAQGQPQHWVTEAIYLLDDCFLHGKVL